MSPKRKFVNMERKEDRRARMTREFLKHALIDLMKSKNINEISVKELCEKADVNRSTFYKHYNTVTELYEDTIRDVTENFRYITQYAEKEGTLLKSNYIESILNYVENNRDLFLVILSEKGNVGFGEFLVKNTDYILNGYDDITELKRYCIYFVVSGMSSIIWKWLNEEERMSAHAVAVLISSLLAHGINRASVFQNSEKTKN